MFMILLVSIESPYVIIYDQIPDLSPTAYIYKPVHVVDIHACQDFSSYKKYTFTNTPFFVIDFS